MSRLHTPQGPLELPQPILGKTKGSCAIWNGLGKTRVGFWLLEPAIHWYGLHCTEGRPYPCLKAVGRCADCEQGYLARQTGFICAMHARSGGRYLLRITEYAYQQCAPLAIVGSNLRGTPVIVNRLGELKNSPWHIEIAVLGPPPPLPASVDTVGVLGFVWGFDLRRLAAEPPADGDIAYKGKPYRKDLWRQR